MGKFPYSIVIGLDRVLQIIRQFVQKLTGKAAVEAPAEPEGEDCCNGVVHIAYRGLSDDRQYVAYSRKWEEIRFFKPNGLKVFCADCRRRLL
jgi:hypothetical protein